MVAGGTMRSRKYYRRLSIVEWKNLLCGLNGLREYNSGFSFIKYFIFFMKVDLRLFKTYNILFNFC